ncbi:hypothetical protein BH10PLA1_BH10PLA1_15980 [soil metagenome]
MSSVPPPIPSPVQVLAYTESQTSVRPAAVTAIGVMSIVFACVGFFGALGGAFLSLGFMINTTAVRNGPNAQVIPDTAGPNGFYATDRDVIEQAFNTRQALSGLQQVQLDFLLSDVGAKILPAVPTAVSNDPAVDYRRSFLAGSAGGQVESDGTFYDVPSGRITVTDHDATFTPAANSIVPAFKRSADRASILPNLTATEIKAVIARVQEHAGNTPLNPAQVAKFTSMLQKSPGTLLGTPGDMRDLLGGIIAVKILPDGSAQVDAPNATVTISSSGARTLFSNGISKPFPPMKVWPLATTMIGGVISAGLSIFLLVIGVITLRNSLVAATLHRVYAWAKIVLTLVGAVATWLIWADFTKGIASQASTASPKAQAVFSSIATAMTVGSVLLGLAYPVTLLLVLRLKSVRAFYAATLDQGTGS